MAKYVKRNNRFKKTGGRLKKRWYFNAGANLPFIGKTNIAFGTSKAKRSLVNMVRNKLEEPLHKLYSFPGSNPPLVTMLQNTIHSINLTGNIPLGDGNGFRNGDVIHLDALKFRLKFSTATPVNLDFPKRYRVMIVKSDVDAGAPFSTAGSTVIPDTWGSSLGATDLFQGNNIPYFEFTNPKACTVLYDKTCVLKPAIAGCRENAVVEDTIRFGSTFTYKTGSNYGKYHNYFIAIMGYQEGATTGTTQVGYAELFGDLIFKDSR